MKLVACTVRGELKWKLDARVNGKGPRQFFDSHADGQKALKDAQKQQQAVGKAFDILRPRDKARIMNVLAEITAAGLTLEHVWQAAKSTPNAPKASCTAQKALDELTAAKQAANCRPKTIKNLKWYIGLFIRGRASADVATLATLEVLNEWFAARNEAPRSKRGHVGLLSTYFDHCWRRRYIAENPVKRLDPVHVDRHTPAILTNTQSWKALTWCRRYRPKLLAWLTLALFCGLRPDSEADHIAWEDIDLKRKRIVIGRSKLRHVPHRIIELKFCPPALAWLKIAKKLGSALPIHFESRRRGIRALRSVLRFKRWPQDVLRHTTASNLLAFHQDAGKVAAFLGNSAGVLLRDYKALVFLEDAKKFLSLSPKPRHYGRRKRAAAIVDKSGD